MQRRSNRALGLGLAAAIALLTSSVPDEARACDEASHASRSDRCDPLFVPRQPASGPRPFLWALATHDERRDYLMTHGVPASLAERLAIGGIPLDGRQRPNRKGWLLVPQSAALRLEARF